MILALVAPAFCRLAEGYLALDSAAEVSATVTDAAARRSCMAGD